MNERDSIRENLLKELYKLPVHNITSDKKEISIRCPNCGDSRKHANHGHLYINIDVHSEKFLQYYCQRCKCKGYTNSEFLRNLKLHNQELVIEIDNEAKRSRKKNRSSYKKKLSKKSFVYPKYDFKDEINIKKLKYINDRLGTLLSMKELSKYKIILNLYDVLNANKITTLTCKDRMGDTLDCNFVGFVSYDNNYIIMRNLSKTEMPDLRYHNYNIYGDYDNTKKFYIIPTKIPTNIEQITVIISEGIFDILNVYFNIETDHTNKIFAAVCGIGYNAVIQEIIRMGFLDINLIIYGDSDQDIKIYNGIKQDNFPFISSLTLYTNKLAKDFGDASVGYDLRRVKL